MKYINEVLYTCYNYALMYTCRVSTRAAIVPFVDPSVGPSNEEEEDVFAELEELIHGGELSKAS